MDGDGDAGRSGFVEEITDGDARSGADREIGGAAVETDVGGINVSASDKRM